MPIFSRIPLSEVGERPPLGAARAAGPARAAGTGLVAGPAAAPPPNPPPPPPPPQGRGRGQRRRQPGQPATPPPPPPPSTYAMCYAISVGPDPLGAVLPLRVRAAAVSRLSASRDLDRRLLQPDELERRPHLRNGRDAEARVRRRSREDAEGRAGVRAVRRRAQRRTSSTTRTSTARRCRPPARRTS